MVSLLSKRRWDCVLNCRRVRFIQIDAQSIRKDLQEFASKQQSPLTMKAALDYQSSVLQMAQFLHEELPIRLARRVIELESLPYNLSDMPSVLRVHEWYESSFRQMRTSKRPETRKDTGNFQFLLENVLTKHNDVVPTMARGIMELKKTMPQDQSIIDTCPFLQDFLDRFFMARIGLRVIISHFTSLCEKNRSPSFIGILEKDCRVASVVEHAAEDASMICQRVYGLAPPVEFYGKTDLSITYIPDHIHHITFELLKNSMRALAEQQAKSADPYDDPPPIRIVMADGDDDITIKISDQGGGIPRKDMKQIFAYAYSTVKDPPELHTASKFNPQLAGLTHVPMAGYGYGLPLSRLYAHVFGGDLVVISMDGHGTDAYLYLNKLHDSSEIVPR